MNFSLKQNILRYNSVLIGMVWRFARAGEETEEPVQGDLYDAIMFLEVTSSLSIACVIYSFSVFLP